MTRWTKWLTQTGRAVEAIGYAVLSTVVLVEAAVANVASRFSN